MYVSLIEKTNEPGNLNTATLLGETIHSLGTGRCHGKNTSERLSPHLKGSYPEEAKRFSSPLKYRQ